MFDHHLGIHGKKKISKLKVFLSKQSLAAFSYEKFLHPYQKKNDISRATSIQVSRRGKKRKEKLEGNTRCLWSRPAEGETSGDIKYLENGGNIRKRNLVENRKKDSSGSDPCGPVCNDLYLVDVFSFSHYHIFFFIPTESMMNCGISKICSNRYIYLSFYIIHSPPPASCRPLCCTGEHK